MLAGYLGLDGFRAGMDLYLRGMTVRPSPVMILLPRFRRNGADFGAVFGLVPSGRDALAQPAPRDRSGRW